MFEDLAQFPRAFYDATTGSLTIGSDILADPRPRRYRRIVAFVQKEPALFRGTIRENIAMG